MLYEVQHRDFNGNWSNVWSESVAPHGEKPMTFDSRQDALCELAAFFEDIKHAVACGDMPEDHGYSADDFRVIELEAAQ